MKEEKENHIYKNVKAKKTIAYIDASNIILSSQRVQIDIDFSKLKKYLEDKFRVSEIYYFTPNLKSTRIDNEALATLKFKVIYKEIYYENSKTKGNCDVEISHFVTKHIENNIVDSLIFLSGDGDFTMLLKYAQSKNVNIKLIPTDVKSTSKMLRHNFYDKITYITRIIHHIQKEKPAMNT